MGEVTLYRRAPGPVYNFHKRMFACSALEGPLEIARRPISKPRGLYKCDRQRASTGRVEEEKKRLEHIERSQGGRTAINTWSNVSSSKDVIRFGTWRACRSCSRAVRSSRVSSAIRLFNLVSDFGPVTPPNNFGHMTPQNKCFQTPFL